MSVNMHQLLKEKLADYFAVNPVHVSLFWKGRVALYAILKAIGIGKGDEVILPAFTCVVAVNPIIYLGAEPVYVDIDPLTYNIDNSLIEPRITEKTKAILAQNTFGLAPDLDAISRLADKHNLLVIEDCAHGFGGSYKGIPNGTVADASFFSSQWNKPFSTGIGGFTVTKEPKLAPKLAEFEKRFLKPTLKDESALKALLFSQGKAAY
jgi:dTDP-4-amino-4,6-dideoxygalactose transaminase